ncbi:MAG TPA: adenylate/guanylate cyclase domain-containing protein [Solirubrobacteraceae bacterium]|nr:adenylate/guanylate cyclase domain-containing protein [Solirubrobacteraceae bacterium]
MEGQETCPLPEDPTLAAMASALNDAGYWAILVDRGWRSVYVTDSLRLSLGGLLEVAPFPVGTYFWGPEELTNRLAGRGRLFTLENVRNEFEMLAPYMLAATEGGPEGLRERVDPRLRDIVDRLSAADLVNALSLEYPAKHVAGMDVKITVTLIPVRDGDGQLVGTVMLSKPAASMAVLGTLGAGGDPRRFERMQQVAKAGRRPAAILFADLESSSPLARRLSTASYFALVRRMVRTADHAVIDAGGLVGRHVGDGVVAFFLAESAGSESTAARSCIQAARNIKDAMSEVAVRSELAPGELTMRFGLHWGATLYVGQIATTGRAEVTALGDEVNEGARVEACATGGRTLASKALLERLDTDDAIILDLDPDHITYTPLTELPTATEKARRDAPAIAVCEV